MASSANSSPPPVLAFVALLALSLLLHSATASSPPPQSPQPASECVTELVMFSPCLGFVSSPPNNLSATVSSSCCDAFSASLTSNSSRGRGSSCLCYLLRQPRMLGFPIDEIRLLSLPSACFPTEPPLDELCSGSQALPPNSGISDPPVSAPTGQPSSSMSLPPSLSPDSKDTSENSSPPSEIADMLLPRPRMPQGLSTSASGCRFCRSKCWFQMGSLVFTFLFRGLYFHAQN